MLVVACVVAGVLACFGGGGSEPHGTPANVPQEWQLARLAPGHAVHVAGERLACEQCHTVASGRFDDPGPAPCAACHAREARIQHASERAQAAFGAAAQADCTDCHAFGAAPLDTSGRLAPDGGRQDGAWGCGRCHDGHRDDGSGATAVTAHRGAACSACHTPHGDTPAAPADCSSCHAVQLVHGRAERDAATGAVTAGPGASPSLHARCRVCHEGLHAPAADSQRGCVDCHATVEPVVAARALFAGGHERCTSCHAPHAFGQAEVVRCADCHQTQPPALAAARVKAHAACESCHDPHDARADPAQACTSCHAQLANDHPAPPGGSACTGCHIPHPARGAGGAGHAASARVPCAQCHAGATGDAGFHARGVGCRECHVPHRFELTESDLSACQRCHAAEIGRARALQAGHGACPQCHTGLPHDTSAEPRACGSCHTEQGVVASAGHRACQGCHEPHAGEVQTACQSCHAPVLTGAPKGHRDCRGCHEPHTGDLAVADCTSCHEAKAKAPHHGVKGGCQSCHGVHGPDARTPPACTSCHERLPREAGLHAVARHQRCSDCHRAHDVQPRPEPEVCRSCHQDRARHFPEARRCSGCHLFESR